ncbi:Mitochondrial import inner membrane translocase subunit tim16 [Neolecta irregularis DAH-3]|uniref:Mitochondrial import inner membrane translocase subunit TIM16 n=1 Tax=Neolecta irregularis (strain DAH-3) TaxID=1198029 RepID=A0A1U7LRM4_NEOID|nr:Mitochondrial import inner membrane translocase subunit tim16 [Neolecta irregularis DAH-3]|eukprot:OLL25171.1 Mitochondrial import inner membrane translocase subunit tim16 [Neolecta irregularis DAH-3]
MAHRIIAQIVVIGTQVVGKAFIEAYRQAAATSAGAARSQAASFGGAAAKDSITQKTGITSEEACQILDVPKDKISLDGVMKRYEKLFTMNEPKNGGSQYLQAKIFRARERLEMELAQKKAASEVQEASKHSDSSSS